MLHRERGRARRAITEAANEYRRSLKSFDVGTPPPATWRQHAFDTDPGRRSHVSAARVQEALADIDTALSRMPEILGAIDSVQVDDLMAQELIKLSGGDPDSFSDELDNAVCEERLRRSEELGYTDEVAAFLRFGNLIVQSRTTDRYRCLVLDFGEFRPEPVLAYNIYDALRAYNNLSSSRFHDTVKIFRDMGRVE
ncbi:hypothetical protein [Nocardiopsis chromatogenes]|uniref:hypothetical protein n=1 Tax=Nocardiopsis chromatogenes TaxID=280239 RepID=UPI000348C19E|nr:hypothetical protein [Nocardiopsis chromatogenes]